MICQKPEIQYQQAFEFGFECQDTNHGKGRVFYVSPSHQPESYPSSGVLRICPDGIRYVLGDHECDDSPVGKNASGKESAAIRVTFAENVVFYRMTFDFSRLITEHQRCLYGYVYSLVGNSTVAWDILQETNIVLWKKQHDFQLGTNFEAWARTTAHFQVLAFLRDRQREPLTLLTPELLEAFRDDADMLAGRFSERLQVLQQCREELGGKARDLITLHYEQGLSMKSVGARLGMTFTAVKQSIFRIRRNLRECIQTKLATQNE